ncbi:MAG: hypothetical protein IT352_11815 [Gemmatimonadales bacterium]|nr:hypothetical protein [Gemmatimonadales bacterium]
MTRSSLCAAVVLVATPTGAGAQQPSRGTGPTLSGVAGPAVIVETWDYATLSLPDSWYEGVSLGARITMPLSPKVSAALRGLAFRAPGGRSLQLATAGLELRAGRYRQVPLNLGFGVVRQPSELLCIAPCPGASRRFGHRSRATLAGSVAYEWATRSGLGIGPEFTVTRAFGGGLRYWSIHLGLRVATGL